MEKNPVYDFLTRVLEIIGYTDDKTDFIDEFMTLCITETNAKIISSLSKEQQQNLTENTKKKIAEKIGELLIEYIPKESYEKKLAECIKNNFEDYIETILNTLDSSTKNKLFDFLSNADSFFTQS